MNPRERTLLTVLFVLIGVLGTAAVFYFFFYQEYADLSSQVAADSDKLTEKKKALKEAEDERDRLLTTNPQLKHWEQYSLPYLAPTKNGAKHSLEETNKHIADVQRRYQDNLESLLKRHHFTGQGGGEVDVKPANWDFKTPDGKGGGLAAKDKVPVYTRLPYVVTASATYANIVEMLKDFYNEPLLQEVRSISIKKSETRQPELTPPSGGRGGTGGAGPNVAGRGGQGGAGPGVFGRGGQGGAGRGAAPDAVADAAPDDVPADVVPGRGGPGAGRPGAAGPGGQRPGRGGQGGRNDASIPLDVKMTVEVLMVTGAEYRTALLPSKIKPGQEAVLGRPDGTYTQDMPARDPFNGKPKVQTRGPGDTEPPEPRPSAELKQFLSFVKLTAIFQNPDRNRWYATFYDQGSGPPEVLVNTLTIPDIRVTDPVTGNRVYEATCVWIDAKQLVFKDKTGKYYLMHIGDYVQEALEKPPLDADALKPFGLTPKKVAVAPE